MPRYSSKPRLVGMYSLGLPRCHLPTQAVRYPRALRTLASVVSSKFNPLLSCGNKTSGTPTRVGYRPVSRAAREGEQTGSAEEKFVKRTPSEARRFRFGVWILEP